MAGVLTGARRPAHWSDPAPPDGDPGIAFNSAVERPPQAPGSERKSTGTPDVMFAVARGMLSALDGDTGNALWVCRVASSNADIETYEEREIARV